MNSPLSNIEVGSSGIIVQFMDNIIAGKLMTMGVLPGSKVRVVRKAPFKGGLYLKIDGSNMVLREKEAETIILSMID
ncbi:MAG: FeoA family protein [Bacteroidota bacterium]